MNVYLVAFDKQCPGYHQITHQQQCCRQLLHSDQNIRGYNMQQQPLQNQAYAAQSQYYSSQGTHNQMMHTGLASCNRQQHHSAMRGHFHRAHSITASDGSQCASHWQQSMNNNAASVGTTQYGVTADQQRAVTGRRWQHGVSNMVVQRQLVSGMQRGLLLGCQQPQPGIDLCQNDAVVLGCESVNTGDGRQQMACQQRDNMVGQQQHQTGGFAGRRPTVGQYSVNVSCQSVTVSDSFTTYQHQHPVQPSQSFAVHQPPLTWSNAQSYTQTGSYTFLISYSYGDFAFAIRLKILQYVM